MSDLRGLAGRRFGSLARRIPFSPNTITSAALVLSLLAAVSLALAARWPAGFPVAILLAWMGGALDVLDGIVAREKGLCSRWGDFLDHFFDRVSDLSLMAGWVIGARIHFTVAIVTLVAVMLNGYVGTQIEASFGRRVYGGAGRIEFFAAILGFPLLAWLAGERIRAVSFGGLHGFDLLTLVIAALATFGVIQRLLRAWRTAHEPETGSRALPLE